MAKENIVKTYRTYRSGNTMGLCEDALVRVNDYKERYIIICYSENDKTQLLSCLDYLQKRCGEKLKYPEIRVEKR